MNISVLGWIVNIAYITFYHIAFCISWGTSQALITSDRIHSCSVIGREAKSALIGLILIQFAIVDPSLVILSVQLTLINNSHRFRLYGAEILNLFTITWVKEIILVRHDWALSQRYLWCFKHFILSETLIFKVIDASDVAHFSLSTVTMAVKDIRRSNRSALIL